MSFRIIKKLKFFRRFEHLKNNRMITGIYTRYYLAIILTILNIVLYIVITSISVDSILFLFIVPATILVIYFSTIILWLEYQFKREILDPIQKEFNDGNPLSTAIKTTFDKLVNSSTRNRFWLGIVFELKEIHNLTIVGLIISIVIGVVILILTLILIR